jgi:methionine-rich copper-binding protein CopC
LGTEGLQAVRNKQKCHQEQAVALNFDMKITVHRQNVEVTNAESTKRRTTKRRMGQNAE